MSLEFDFDSSKVPDTEELFKEIVPRDKLKQHVLDKKEKQAEDQVRLHIALVFRTIEFFYKQNYMKWCINPEHYKHPLYHRMVSELRENGYEVKVIIDLNRDDVTDDEKDEHTGEEVCEKSIGTLLVRWDTEENPEPSACERNKNEFDDDDEDSFLGKTIKKITHPVELFLAKHRRLVYAVTGGLVGGYLWYIGEKVSLIKGPVGV
jgi:hypothetical protein